MQQLPIVRHNFIAMPKNHVSKLERDWQLKQLFRTNRHLFDIQELLRLEKTTQVMSRKPTDPFEAIGTRASTIFTSTDYSQIAFHKDSISPKAAERTVSILGSHVPSTLGLDRMLTRQKRAQTLDPRPSPDQRRFLNFSIEEPQTKTLDFSKMRTYYSKNLKQKQMIELDSIALAASRDRLRFNEATMKCSVRYTPLTARKNPESKSPPSVDVQKLDASLQKATKGGPKALLQFYNSVGHNAPSAMDYRYLQESSFYFPRKRMPDSIEQDFSLKSQKEELRQRRVEAIKARKHIPDVRGQFCVQKYFRRKAE